MIRPEHFYKYVSADTAKIILKNKTLRWSAPSRFNDPFDLQFDMHVEYDREKLAEEVVSEQWSFYSGEKEFIPGNRLGFLLQELSKKRPLLDRKEFEETVRKGVAESLATQERILPQLHAELRRQLNPVQLLCLSETPTNILMWSHYANNHTGVVLRLSYIEALQSPWGAAQPVRYQKNMPLLFDHGGMLRFLTGQSAIDKERILDEAVTVKAIDWEYEKEWRVVYHGDELSAFEDTPFDMSQMTGIYFGCRTADEDWAEIADLAQAANAAANVFCGRKSDRKFEIEFEQIA